MVSPDALIVMRRHAFATAVEVGFTRCGVGAGDRVLVACSGGADSVALLLATAALASLDKWALDVHVAHVHHHLRNEADDDAKFVADLAERWTLHHHRRDIHPGDASGNVEANARLARYDALADIAQDIDADHIATAHHADDQLETILMRLVRGSGPRGLRGILPVRRCTPQSGRLIRPMLGTTHDEAIAYLRESHQPWREDHTNADTTRTRARLRAEVLPVLKSLNPKAAQNANKTAQRLRRNQREDAKEQRSKENPL